MIATIEILEGGWRNYATLDLKSVASLGRIIPRLQLNFEGRPESYTKVVLDDATLRLEFRNELIGEGRVTGIEITYDRSAVTFEVVTSQRLLRHVTDGLTSADPVVQLDARLHGRGRVRVDPSAPESNRMARPVGWEPGQWWPFALHAGMPSALQFSRADWYQQVLSPTRSERFRYLEVALPLDDSALGAEWGKAVGLLVNAERAYAAGDDPSVFQQLRGALDSLPGAKQQILAGISDDKKRADLENLLKQAGQFLHDGRHVAADGEQAGTFPVNHLDAAFAVDLMRVLLSRLSLMLSADRQRAVSA